MLDFLWKILPTYEGVTPLIFAMYALAGVFGALVRVAWLDKPLRGFYKNPTTGGVQMGFYAEIIVGIAVAIMIDGHPIRAGIAAVFAPWILDGMKTVIVGKIPAALRAVLESAMSGKTK